MLVSSSGQCAGKKLKAEKFSEDNSAAILKHNKQKKHFIYLIYSDIHNKVNHCICINQIEIEIPFLCRTGLSTSHEQRQTVLSRKHFTLKLLSLKINNTTFNNLIEYFHDQQSGQQSMVPFSRQFQTFTFILSYAY